MRFVFLVGSAALQIFNDLDVQDDKLMLDLAVFLNRLVRRDYTGLLSRECCKKRHNEWLCSGLFVGCLLAVFCCCSVHWAPLQVL